jgi:hypothetical protein
MRATMSVRETSGLVRTASHIQTTTTTTHSQTSKQPTNHRHHTYISPLQPPHMPPPPPPHIQGLSKQRRKQPTRVPWGRHAERGTSSKTFP